MQQDLISRKRLCEQHLQTLSEISLALGKKDRYTQAHGHRVALYAMRLAGRLGFPAKDIRNIGIGGLFHDVGKLALNDIIFTNRETRLSNDLEQEVRCHPLIGAALLKHIDFLEPVVDFVLFHHEREDGNGYPYGLRAGEIPPGAKIVSIADCFDAVTTDRPYQKGQSVESAYEILREGCRRFFCEAYVEVFIEDVEENGMIRETGSHSLLADELVRSAAGGYLM
jgi:HD-GYP domain-containing protein (c-di-GMP phosphodiesterase class II)